MHKLIRCIEEYAFRFDLRKFPFVLTGNMRVGFIVKLCFRKLEFIFKHNIEY